MQKNNIGVFFVNVCILKLIGSSALEVKRLKSNNTLCWKAHLKRKRGTLYMYKDLFC